MCITLTDGNQWIINTKQNNEMATSFSESHYIESIKM